MRRFNGENGVAAVEFALIVPFLLVAVFMAIDIGDAMYVRVHVQEAAQEGAMFAAYRPASPGDIRQRVVESTSRPALSINDVTVSCPDPGVIRVTVEHEHVWLAGWLPGPLEMTAVVDGTIVTSTACVGS